MFRTASRDVSPSADRLQPIVNHQESSNEDPTLTTAKDPNYSAIEDQPQSLNVTESSEDTPIKSEALNPIENQENLPTQNQQNLLANNQEDLSANTQEHALSTLHENTLVDSKEAVIEEDKSDMFPNDKTKEEKIIEDESSLNENSLDTIKAFDSSKTAMELIAGAIKNVAELSEKVIETQSDSFKSSMENEIGKG